MILARTGWVLAGFVAAIVLALSAACGAAPAAGPRVDAAGNPVAADDVQPLGVLTDLGACDPAPPAAAGFDEDGVFLPPGTVVTDVEHTGAGTTLRAWVRLTPSQLRRTYEQLDGIDVVMREDERDDAEVSYTDGQRRVFVKAVAVCEAASTFVVVVSGGAEASS